MNWVNTISAVLVVGVVATSAFAEELSLEDRLHRLEQQLEQTQRQYRELEQRAAGKDHRETPPATPSLTPGIGPLSEVGRERRTTEQQGLSFGSTGSGRLVYAKPFVSSPRAILGGYADASFRSQRLGTIDNGYGAIRNGQGLTNNFDNQRFVPFIYGDISEHLKFAAELELEHGIREEGGPDRELEIGLEFAHFDYLIREAFNLRAGILLVPIGKFNLLHDSPLNDLTDRPLVSQLIIPTTMSETGAGLYGTLYPGSTSKVDYELYVTTGPCGHETDGTPTINEATGTRGARQRKCGADDGFDINNGKAFSGRLAYSPFLGVEVAGSGYYGNASPSSYNPLQIVALDWTFQRGPWELIGEAAWAYARGNARAIPNNTLGFAPGSLLAGLSGNSQGLAPQRMDGFYIQANYHFMPEWVTRLAPQRFGPGSTFTAVVRYDRVNTNRDNKTGGFGELEQISLGLNYRPIEDAVIKMSYQYQPQAFDPIASTRVHNSAFVLSVASYF